MKVINDLFDYENLKIVQNEDYFKFSIDSILLAEYAKINNSDNKILDLCSGNLPIPFILNYKYHKKIDAIELQNEIYNYGKESIEINKLEEDINYINDNVKNIFNYYEEESFDVITCNPPYFKESLKNENNIKSIARHEIEITLEDIIRISSKLLKSNKTFYLVHVPNRIDEIILLCNKYNMNVKEITVVNNSKMEAILILIKAVKNSKVGLKFKYLNDANNLKSYKNIF